MCQFARDGMGAVTYIFNYWNVSETRCIGIMGWGRVGSVCSAALEGSVLGVEGRREGIAAVLNPGGGDVFGAGRLVKDLDHVKKAFGPLVSLFGGNMGQGVIGREVEYEALHAGKIKGGRVEQGVSR